MIKSFKKKKISIKLILRMFHINLILIRVLNLVNKQGEQKIWDKVYVGKPTEVRYKN